MHHTSSLSTWQPPSCAQIQGNHVWNCQPQRNELFPTSFLQSTTVSEYSSAFGSLSAVSCLRSSITHQHESWNTSWISTSSNFGISLLANTRMFVFHAAGWGTTKHHCFRSVLLPVVTGSSLLHINPCLHKHNCEQARHLQSSF